MDEVEPQTGTTQPRSVRRLVRRHVFATVVVAGALLGGGLRLVPTNAAASPGPDAADQGVAASTACAAS
jgi:hypothetical protein